MYVGLLTCSGPLSSGWQRDHKSRDLDSTDERQYRGNREDRGDGANREGEGDMWSNRWDHNKQIIEQVRERWSQEAMSRRPRERKRDVEERVGHQRKDRGTKTTWRGEEEGHGGKERKSSSRDGDRRRKDEVKSRNIVCHSISDSGSSHRSSVKPFSSKKREGFSLLEQQGKAKRRRSGESTSSFRSSPRPEKVKREASHSLEELENALKMVEQEEKAVATRDELKSQIEEMKKKKLEKAQEGLGQQSILVKDFTEMDEYFGKFGAIVGITKVSEGFSRIDFVNVAAADKAKKAKDHWPKDSKEYEATRSKSVKPRDLTDVIKEDGETSSISSEDDYGQRWTCLECHHDNFSWSKECSQCAAKQQCEGQALRSSSELQHQGQALEASSISELADWRIEEGKFGKCSKEEITAGRGVVDKKKNIQGEKCDADKTVPIVDLADSSEEEKEENKELEIKELDKEEIEDTFSKDHKVKEDISSKDQKVKDILESLEKASKEEQDIILGKLGIVRRVKRWDKQGISDSLSDAGLYSDGDDEKEEELDGKVN